MSYCTLSDTKLYLGIASTVTDDDALLNQLISRAQDIIDMHAGQTFEATANSSRYYDAVADVHGDTLYLDAPLASINAITNGDGTTVSSTYYVTEPRNDTPYYAIRLLASSSITWESQADGDSENAITISGKWGYSVMAPPSVQQACVRLVAWLYRQKDTSADLDRPILAGDGNVIMPSRIPADIYAMIPKRIGVG